MGRNLDVCHFPAHQGEYWEDVIRDDREYVEWLISGSGPTNIDPELYDHLNTLLEEIEDEG